MPTDSAPSTPPAPRFSEPELNELNVALQAANPPLSPELINRVFDVLSGDIGTPVPRGGTAVPTPPPQA